MKIFLATPAYRGLVCPQYLDSLEETVNLFLLKGIDSQYQMLQGCCYVQVARNDLVKAFLESDCDKILFLDDDISWKPEDAVRLVTTDKPVVAGVYPVKKAEETFPVVLVCGDDHKPVVEDNMLLAGAVPTGFLCIDRSVFTKFQAAYPHLKYVDKKDINDETEEWSESFDYFPQGVHNERWVGEDYAFCHHWRAIGGKIYVIPDMEFEHHSHNNTWRGSLWEYLKRLPGGANHEG